MRILAISDEEEPWLDDHFDKQRLEGVDLIVSCGDLGADYLERVVTLANRPLAYVRGNHDQSFDEVAPGGCDSIEGLLRDYHGLRMLGLGGSLPYNDRVYGFTEYQMWKRARRLSRKARLSGGVDLIVTHAAPLGYGDLPDLPHRGFDAFNKLLVELHPRYLIHGHVHLNYDCRMPRVMHHPSGTTLINVFGSYLLDIPDDDIPSRGGLRVRPLF